MMRRLGRRDLVLSVPGGLLLSLSARSAYSQCQSIEIYPGYPGYRGYVTGVDGVGDHACLETLLALSPDFDQNREDRLNREAAIRLGLAGNPEVWTWENWMSVEAERGLSPVCYWCAFVEADRRVPPVGIAPTPGDPRLAIGNGTTSWWRAALARDRGLPEWSVTDLFPTDQHLRANVLLTNPSPHLNAEQLLAAAEAMVDGLNISGGATFDPVALLRVALDQGGYAPTPPTAAQDDQVIMLISAFLAVGTLMPDGVSSAFLSQLDLAIEGWLADRAMGETASLAAWILSNDAVPLVTA